MKKSRAFAGTLSMAAALAASILPAATVHAADPPTGGGSTVATESPAAAEPAAESRVTGESPAAVEPAAESRATGESPAAVEPGAAAEPTAADSTAASETHAAAAPGVTTDSSDDGDLLQKALGAVSSRVHLRLYGFLNAQVEMAQATGGATPYQGRGRVSDGNSRLGFAGSVDIAGGLRAIWQLEGGLGSFEQGGRSDRGIFATLESRNTFAGLEHPEFGRLIFGYNDSAYRTLVGSAGAFGGNLGLTRTGLDLWNNTTAQMSGNADSLFSRGEDRYANSLHYDSPLVYGLQLALSYSFDEAGVNARLRNRYSAGLTYEYGPFKVGVGYDHQSNTGVDQRALFYGLPFSVGAADGASTSFMKALAAYVNPSTMTSVAAGVELERYGYSSFLYAESYDALEELREGTMRQMSTMASVSQGVGFGVTLMASGGKLLKLDDAVVGSPADYEAWQFSAGAKYMLGEHFTAYIVYTQIENASRQNVNFGQAPVYSNELGTADAYLAPGDSPRSLGLGILARF